MNNQGLLAKPKIVFILFIFVFSLGIGGLPVHAEDREVDIQTNPHGYLFQVDNLKPGDWMPRNITVKNNGLMDFKYIARIGDKKSVKGLFEELEFMVKKENDLLYDGKLKDFTGFSPRELAKGSEETLFLQVKVPETLGNSFQGSSAEVEIIFLAERIGDSTPTDPGEDPDPTDPGEDPDPTDPGEDPDPTDPGEDPDPTDPGEDPDPTDPGEDPDPTDPGEDPDPTDPGEDPDPTNPGENPDLTDPGENPNPTNPNPADPVNNPNPTVPEDEQPAQDIVVSPEVVNTLPNTATNHYNILIAGLLATIGGGFLLLIYIRKIRNAG
ncbi:MAG: TasA family protein [Cytobacillus gottheilii]|uniref:TasA family protein n=1 Tax=Cytobacillus gottheilii TaxID=859144 RepID=UPI000836B3E7|nr:TasA family protein [Cytobacillus gottheilii]